MASAYYFDPFLVFLLLPNRFAQNELVYSCLVTIAKLEHPLHGVLIKMKHFYQCS